MCIRIKAVVDRDIFLLSILLSILIGSSNSVETAFHLSRYLNQNLYDSKRLTDSFVGDNQGLPISNKCSVLECYKTIKECDTTGLICECCDIITCKPHFPAAKILVNGKSRLTTSMSREDKNLVLLSRVSYFFHRFDNIYIQNAF